MYEYKVKITRVIDGDTVDADVDLGFDLFVKDRIRLMAIDTPESRTRNKSEKILGLASKKRLKELCAMHKGKIILKTSKEGKGKFGRILGSIYAEGSEVSFNDILISEGHARPYFGGSKSEQGEWTTEIDGKLMRWTASGYVEFIKSEYV